MGWAATAMESANPVRASRAARAIRRKVAGLFMSGSTSSGNWADVIARGIFTLHAGRAKLVTVEDRKVDAGASHLSKTSYSQFAAISRQSGRPQWNERSEER